MEAHMDRDTDSASRYWLGVVALAHVQRGVAGGFAQLCHGRAAPLRRMRAGDWLVYYSPTTERGGGQRLEAFTALGQLVDDDIFDYDMGGGFTPARRRVRYEPVRPIVIQALEPELHLTACSHWGVALRRGHLQLDAHDFNLIARTLRA
jgi:hypothetical protein